MASSEGEKDDGDDGGDDDGDNGDTVLPLSLFNL
jgi:hypothetical protein